MVAIGSDVAAEVDYRWDSWNSVEWSERPKRGLQAFIDAVKNIGHRESVRLKTKSWNGTAEVITLKLDKQYWPAYEIRRGEDNGWKRYDLGS